VTNELDAFPFNHHHPSLHAKKLEVLTEVFKIQGLWDVT
jgi:hypothetical protein